MHASRPLWVPSLLMAGLAVLLGFGEDAERLAARTREEYVADTLRRSDIQFRENAIRGLGVIGNNEAAGVLEAASAQDPNVKMLADAALREIAERN